MGKVNSLPKNNNNNNVKLIHAHLLEVGKPSNCTNFFFLIKTIIYKYIWIVGHKNSNKVLVPRVISVVENPIIVSRRPHAWTIRPRQWHVIKGGSTVEKKLQR